MFDMKYARSCSNLQLCFVGLKQLLPSKDQKLFTLFKWIHKLLIRSKLI